MSIRDSQYRTAAPETTVSLWEDPIVKMANEKVPVTRLLTEHFATHVPEDADGWKVRCPFYAEHEDGGIDRQFRVWSAANRGFCFALHGVLDPVNLWRYKSFFPSMRDAAESLLTAYDIDFRPKPYQERMAALREASKTYQADPEVIVQVLNLYLERLPGYEEGQYSQPVLRGVNSVMNEVRPFCATDPTAEEVEEWLKRAKGSLRQTVTSPS